jgi:D-alanyl-D-alanine carboxypeptidase
MPAFSRRPLAPRFTVFTTAICCLFLLVGCGGSGAATRTTPTTIASPVVASPVASPIPTATATPTATPYPTPPPSPLVDTVDALLADEQGVFGILITTPDGKIIYSRNADTPFVTASLYKLVLIADMYRRRERGRLSFDQTIELKAEYFYDWDPASEMYFDKADIGSFWRIDDLLWVVGVYSSNVGARALLSLTSTSALNQTAQKIGMTHTVLLTDLQDMPN